jgi:Phage ABA sandwich domain
MIKNFNELNYHRKVDVLIAMHVFNRKVTIIDVDCGKSVKRQWLCTWLPEEGPAEPVLCYSTLLTSAWEIVKKFDYIYLFRSHDFKKGQWECKLRDERGPINTNMLSKHYGWAETEMLAICYAGLKAVDFDLESFLKEEKRDGVA